jgi:PAP2 superfamily
MSLFSDFNIEQFKGKKPPSDGSLTTYKEINDIKRTPIDKQFVEYNDDQEKVFKDIFQQKGIPFPEDTFKQLNNDSADIITKLKNYHGRTRPQGLAKGLGLNLDVVNMDTAKTKSYPSGHSAQSKLFANAFSEMYPKYKRDFMQAADNISKSRLIGRVHYASDSKVGEELGDAMYNHIKQKNGI